MNAEQVFDSIVLALRASAPALARKVERNRSIVLGMIRTTVADIEKYGTHHTTVRKRWDEEKQAWNARLDAHRRGVIDDDVRAYLARAGDPDLSGDVPAHITPAQARAWEAWVATDADDWRAEADAGNALKRALGLDADAGNLDISRALGYPDAGVWPFENRGHILPLAKAALQGAIERFTTNLHARAQALPSPTETGGWRAVVAAASAAVGAPWDVPKVLAYHEASRLGSLLKYGDADREAAWTAAAHGATIGARYADADEYVAALEARKAARTDRSRSRAAVKRAVAAAPDWLRSRVAGYQAAAKDARDMARTHDSVGERWRARAKLAEARRHEAEVAKLEELAVRGKFE